MEFAPGCGADSNQLLTKPRFWFENVRISPSQTGWRRFRLCTCARKDVIYYSIKIRKLMAFRLVLLQLSVDVKTMQYCFLHKDLCASGFSARKIRKHSLIIIIITDQVNSISNF
jgi:hypothetical protein